MFFGLVKGERRSAGRRRAIRSVLVVEDEPLVAFDNEHALTLAGYHVAATVEDHAHAIDVMAEEQIDLVIADVRLHGRMTGIDVASHAHEKGVPVLFVTGSCPAQARHLAVGCLAKPFGPRDLIAAIEAVDALLRGLKPSRLPMGLRIFEEAV